MHKTLYYLLIIFLVSFYEANAQGKFKNGFVITLNHDTIYGKVEYKIKSQNDEVCLFKINDVITEYPPDQILGFGYSKTSFFSSGILDNSFVELLVDGKLRLFKHNGLIIQKQDGPIYKLEKNDKEVELNGSKFMNEDNRWRGIILTLVSDADLDIISIQKMSFDEEKIVELVRDYNQRTGSYTQVYYEFKEKIRMDFGFFAGVSQSSLNVNIIDQSYSYLDDKYGSIDLAFGLLYNVTLPGLSKRLAFQTEIDFLKSHFLSSTFISEQPSLITYYDTDIQFSTISVPVGLRYTLSEKKWATYFLGGLAWNCNFNSSATITSERVLNNIVTTDEEEVSFVNRFQIGYWGGLETQRQFENFKIGASLRYQYVSNLNDFAGFSSSINRFSFSILLIK